MEYVYAAMLLHAAGKDMTEDAVTATLAGAGVDVDAARVKALCASLAGVDIADAMTQAVAAPAAAAPVMRNGVTAASAVEKLHPEPEPAPPLPESRPTLSRATFMLGMEVLMVRSISSTFLQCLNDDELIVAGTSVVIMRNELPLSSPCGSGPFWRWFSAVSSCPPGPCSSAST